MKTSELVKRMEQIAAELPEPIGEYDAQNLVDAATQLLEATVDHARRWRLNSWAFDPGSRASVKEFH